MASYQQIKDDWYTSNHEEIFFAFSNDQYKEGKARMPEGAQIYRGPAGMFGTDKGFTDWKAASKANDQRVIDECTPEEVYRYEYSNHECGFTCDDTEAVDIVLQYWPDADIQALRKERKVHAL
jgi:hypothetical protein